MNILLLKKAVLVLGLVLLPFGQVMADKVDQVLSKGKLACGVVLEFPPMGFKDSSGKPAGLDVDMCADLAQAMKVELEIVSLSWADRIPSLVSGRVDVAIASSSDTLERAQSVGFTIPYMKFRFQALLSDRLVAPSWNDLQNLRVGAVVGTTYESQFLDYKKKHWVNTQGTYSSFESEKASFEALANGDIDAVIVTDTVVANTLSSGRYSNLRSGPIAPFGEDIVGMMTLRKEYGWLNYLNLFINHQVRSGRFQALYGKWIGGQAPSMTVPGVYY